jgi:hypothetical protein
MTNTKYEIPTTLPQRTRGRPSASGEARYQAEVAEFCRTILKINSTLDFRVSSRGWAYILEGKGIITKGDFDAAQRLINDCRKSGDLPLDICSVDSGRSTLNLENIDETSPEEEAEAWVEFVRDSAHKNSTPVRFWDFQSHYVEMAVEKIDLQNLFAPVCKEFHVPLANISGWNDINTWAAMMQRFGDWELEHKRCVLLYCGDHDPGGVHISEFLRKNFNDLTGAVGWSAENLTIHRFGLNFDFIEEQRLTWIDNLETSNGLQLDDPDHHDHKEYVQDYIERFGARKVEANALVIRPDAGRDLCRSAILKYVSGIGIRQYQRRLAKSRKDMRAAVRRLLNGGAS